VRSACFSKLSTDGCSVQAVKVDALAAVSWLKGPAWCGACGERELNFSVFVRKVTLLCYEIRIYCRKTSGGKVSLHYI
jgi:hypothetical protein